MINYFVCICYLMGLVKFNNIVSFHCTPAWRKSFSTWHQPTSASVLSFFLLDYEMKILYYIVNTNFIIFLLRVIKAFLCYGLRKINWAFYYQDVLFLIIRRIKSQQCCGSGRVSQWTHLNSLNSLFWFAGPYIPSGSHKCWHKTLCSCSKVTS